MFTDSQVKGSINSVDRQLLYDIRELLIEQNALLSRLINENNRDQPVDINNMKRPDIMKMMSKKNPPQGWNKWTTDKMKDYLKGAS